MANETKVQNAKTEKPQKELRQTAVDFLKASAVKGGKDKETVVKRALEDAQKKGVTKNSKGHTLTVENLTSLLNAMCRDVISERGAGKNGWWSTYTVVDDEAGFKFVPKK